MNIDISNLSVYIEQNLKSWIDILSALLTPMIAILTGLIAYLQWKTNERKRKQDLFDMRYDNLYFPIFTCIQNITQIKEVELSDEEKAKKIEDEIQKFWQHYCKYKFLISNEDSEKLSKHYNLILDILQKYDYKNMKMEEDTEGTLSVIALMYHIVQMESILTKYLRVEPDSITYKLKCRLIAIKNKIIPNKNKQDSLPVEKNNSNNEVPNE